MSAIIERLKVNKFENMGFDKAILKAVEAQNYEIATPIQTQAIPVINSGKDVLGIAQTGTGKTAAFALPILNRLYESKEDAIKRGCRCLVIAPTRELVSQIAKSFDTYGKFTGLKVMTLFGGVAHKSQINHLVRGVDIIVATPGRLVDHMKEGNVRLNSTEILVLDEVDQMLDMGFITPIRKIVAKLPEERQNLFFSATMPKEIQKFADELLTNPVRIEVAPVSTTAEKVEQSIIHVDASKKRALLTDLLDKKDYSKVLIFSRTRHGADKIAKHLGQFGVHYGIIHGDKNQNQRQKSLEAFREGQIRALVATDVAARGIDVAGISHVINFDMPLTPESYVHRIGRTARAGTSGKSISFCTPQERSLLRSIERLIKQEIQSEDRLRDNTLIMDKHLVPADDVVATEEFIRERPARGEGRGRGRDGGGRDGGRGRDAGRGRDRDRAPRSEGNRFEGGNRFKERAEINHEEELRVMLDFEAQPWEQNVQREEIQGDFKFARKSSSRDSGDREYKPREPREPRAEGRPEGRSEGRSEARREGGRPEYRPAGGRREARGAFNAEKRAPRAEGRSEGRSFESRGPRPEGRSDGRSFAPRGEGRSFENRGPRPEGRSEGRSFENRGPRPEGRSEGRSFENRGPRPEGRSEGRSFENRGPRPEGRSEGRSFENRGPRPEGRSEGRSFENRGPRPEGRSDGRSFAPRGEGRGRPEGRSFENRGPRPEGRSEGRSDAPRGGFGEKRGFSGAKGKSFGGGNRDGGRSSKPRTFA